MSSETKATDATNKLQTTRRRKDYQAWLVRGVKLDGWEAQVALGNDHRQTDTQARALALNLILDGYIDRLTNGRKEFFFSTRKVAADYGVSESIVTATKLLLVRKGILKCIEQSVNIGRNRHVAIYEICAKVTTTIKRAIRRCSQFYVYLIQQLGAAVGPALYEKCSARVRAQGKRRTAKQLLEAFSALQTV